MAKASDFKTSDKVTNSLFKGAGFNKGGESAKQVQQPQQLQQPKAKSSSQPVSNEFDDRDDEEKAAKAAVAQLWGGKQDAGQFSMNMNNKYGINMEKIARAIGEVQKRGNGVPWWSAARDFNLELFRGGNAGNMFKLNPNVIAAVQQKKY